MTKDGHQKCLGVNRDISWGNWEMPTPWKSRKI